MITYIVSGFMIAVFVMLLFATIWILAKAKLERWTYDFNRETHNLLRETQRKLDSIISGQDRLLSQIDRLAETQRSTTNDLRARLASPLTGS